MTYWRSGPEARRLARSYLLSQACMNLSDNYLSSTFSWQGSVTHKLEDFGLGDPQSPGLC